MGDDEQYAWILEDDECGQFAIASGDELQRLVAVHFAVMHGRFGTLVEGVDFRCIAPVLRCDLCAAIAELPWWQHRADPPLSDVGDDDGVWLACDPCHDLIMLKDVDGLIERMQENMAAGSPGMMTSPWAPAIVGEMRKQTRRLVLRLDGGRREER